MRKVIVNTVFKTLGGKFDYFKKYITSVFFVQKPNFDPKNHDLIWGQIVLYYKNFGKGPEIKK